ncbi:MAG TPA: glycosyltransferase [Mucilaginibacter sp.]|jgi:rhamnosyltransferase
MEKLIPIAGCVILFNSENNVWNNILSYGNSVSLLIVIDNSTFYNTDLVNKLKKHNNVQYINNDGNLGVAKALNISATIAISRGFKWMLTMDQDSYIKNDFFNMVNPLLSNYKNIIIAASYNKIFYKPRKSEYSGFVEVGTVITSGNLLNLDGWKSLGGFCEKLFIDEVDNEFCIRAIRHGFKILATKTIYLNHNLGSEYLKTNIFSRKTLSLTKHSSTRLYYMTRNNLFLWKKYFLVNPCLIYNRVKNLFKLIYEITFYYPDKISYYKNIAKGVFHFFISKYDKM